MKLSNANKILEFCGTRREARLLLHESGQRIAPASWNCHALNAVPSSPPINPCV